ncbi:MAG: hypothetical protein QXQ53_04455 [Candidatus Methanosuratincola sp.]
MMRKKAKWCIFDPFVAEMLPMVKTYVGLNDEAFDWAIEAIKAGMPLDWKTSNMIIVGGNFEPIARVEEMEALRMWGGSYWVGKPPKRE